MAFNLEVEIKMKTPTEKVWSSIKELATVFPKALPHIFESFDVLEGDGKAVGSILMVSYKQELMEKVWTMKERIELVDEEKKIFSYSFIDGGILKYYKNFKTKIYVSSKNDGALVKYCVEYDKSNEEASPPDFFTDFVVRIFKDLDAYLLD